MGPLKLTCCLVVALAATCRAELSPDERRPDPFFVDPARLRLDRLAIEWLDRWIGQDEDRAHIKRLLLDRASDYDAGQVSAEQLVERNGFRHELHQVGSADHYQTELVRIVNPRMNRTHLRPPVVLYGGQSVSPALFVAAGVGQHHPEAWPRSADAPVAGAGRSLAFALANEGHDVWLLPARGVDSANRKRSPTNGNLRSPNTSPLERVSGAWRVGDRRASYWGFSSDDIVEYELPGQLEYVRAAARADQVALVTFADGAALALAHLSRRPAHQQHGLSSLVSLGPLVFGNPHSLALRTAALFAKLQTMASLNGFLGLRSPLLAEQVDDFLRDHLSALCTPRLLRYALCKPLLDLAFGPSDHNFRTHLDLNLLRHIARPQSARSLVQLADNAAHAKLSAFDYGPLLNPLLHLSLGPPEYRLDQVRLPGHLLLVGGSRDAVATPWSVVRLERALCGHQLTGGTCGSLRVEGYNHLDLIAAHDVEQQVNRHVLRLLDGAGGSPASD